MKMHLKYQSTSLFQKDMLDRQKWNNLSLEQLWECTFNKEVLKFICGHELKKIKRSYFNLKIKHEGVSKDEYLKHPLRMCLFFKKYFPNTFPKAFILICFHNILEVTDLDKIEIINNFGKDNFEKLLILTIERSKQRSINYLKNYYKKIIENNICFLVKIVDKYDNLFDLKNNKSISIKKFYINEIEAFIKPELDKNGSFRESFLQNIIYNKSLLNDK